MPSSENNDGTVFSLKPKEPLLVKRDTKIRDAAQLMGQMKSDCVLVVDDKDGELMGIVTAKDLAFKVVGSHSKNHRHGEHSIDDPISEIMTSNPMCARTKTKARDALNLMVNRKFRHLPIVDDENGIVGVLDITKCYEVSMIKMEEMYSESIKLYEAMGTVEGELKGYNKMNIKQPAYIIRYFESLRKLLSGPMLSQVLDDERTSPIYCKTTTTVTDAAIMMKKNKTTAVLVRNNDESVVGILTSKDVVSRVIGNGINSNECLVERVMTGNPSSSSKDTSVSKALRQMFEGKYLNLPVVDESGEIVGIVDVIRLTHFTLNQIQTMESINDDNEDSEKGAGGSFWLDEKNGYSEDEDISMDEIAQFDIGGMPSDQYTISSTRSTLTSNHGHGPKKMKSMVSMIPIDYNEKCFIKFRLSGSRVHRLSYRPSDGLTGLIESIWNELNTSERDDLDVNDVNGVELSYHDDDGDMIIIGTEPEWKDCVEFMACRGKSSIEVIVHDGDISSLGKRGNIGRGESNNKLLPISLLVLASAIIIGVTFTRLKR